MAAAPPEEEDTPEDEEIPDEVPDEEDEEDVPLPVDDDPDEDGLSTDRCGSVGVKCANLAPMTAAAPADSRPTRQVIFLTRRSPLSRAAAALEYWVRITASGSPVILCVATDVPLCNVRVVSPLP